VKRGSFRFYAELNDFLPEGRRNTFSDLTFRGRQSVKHLVESLGVPHTEVVKILVNGERVGMDYLVQDGDRVQVYPVSQGDSQTAKGAQNPHHQACFVIDNHLGRLAYYLRMLGFDAVYRNDIQDDELAYRSAEEGRILLTRDVRLLMRNAITRGYWVRSLAPREQLVEVVGRFELVAQIRPFRRCMRCNGVLEPVSKEAILDRLEPLTKKYFYDFRICPQCLQVYWKGSHYDRMQSLIGRLFHTQQGSGDEDSL
jgi:uncharacterized protein with PIN domain/sulfur carrier protein ThiS